MKADKDSIKTLRIPLELAKRVEEWADKVSMKEAEFYRQIILAGLDLIDSGKYNPFSSPRISEDPPEYGREKRVIPSPVTSASENTVSKKKKIRKH